jgi:hypothetical protein
MSMRRTQRERGLDLGREKDQVFLKLIEAKAPYEERRRALLELEKRWLREAATEVEREQLRRGIAEDLVTLAYSFNKPWAEFGKWLRRVQRLGFSNLALRVHVTCLYVQALSRSPEVFDTYRAHSPLRKSPLCKGTFGHLLRPVPSTGS